MLESLGNAFSAVKDGVVMAAAKAWLNGKIADFGSVTRLEFDSKQRTALLEVALKGEASPITVSVGSYTVAERGGAKYITLRGVGSSREWVTLAAARYLDGREFKIPDSVAGML